MFWKKSLKPSDRSTHGAFSLGDGAAVVSQGAKVSSGETHLTPANSDSPPSGAVHWASQRATSVQPPEIGQVTRKEGVPKYVVPKGYRVTSSTFVQGALRVDGELGGRGIAAHSVTISEGGVVSAPVEAGALRVFGRLHAPADVRGCTEVFSSAEVLGPISSSELTVEPGAHIASPQIQVG